LTEENTVVGRLLSGGNPGSVSREIVAALADSRRAGYHATFEEVAEQDGELTVRVSVLTVRQTIRIPGRIWRHRGGIRRAVVNELAI
jgi:hypothetical protein